MTVDAYLRDGSEIYRRSFAIIRAEADLQRVPPDLEPAVVRMAATLRRRREATIGRLIACAAQRREHRCESGAVPQLSPGSDRQPATATVSPRNRDGGWEGLA